MLKDKKPKIHDSCKKPNYPALDPALKAELDTIEGRKRIAESMCNPVRGSSPAPYTLKKNSLTDEDPNLDTIESRKHIAKSMCIEAFLQHQKGIVLTGDSPAIFESAKSGGLGPSSYESEEYTVKVSTKDLTLDQIYYLVVLLRQSGMSAKDAFNSLKNKEEVILRQRTSKSNAQILKAEAFDRKGIIVQIIEL